MWNRLGQTSVNKGFLDSLKLFEGVERLCCLVSWGLPGMGLSPEGVTLQNRTYLIHRHRRPAPIVLDTLLALRAPPHGSCLSVRAAL